MGARGSFHNVRWGGLRGGGGVHGGVVTRDTEPLPLSLGEAFSRREARALGVPDGRLRRRDLERPFHGARLTPEGRPDDDDSPLALDRRMRRTILRRARAYARVAPAGAFLIGSTALAVHDLPLRVGADAGPLHVGIHAPLHAPRGVGVRGRKVSPWLARRTILDGLPVADVASAWALLAEHESIDRLIVVGDAIVRVPRGERGHPHPENQKASIDQLRAAADAPWRRGRAKLARALEDVRVGSMSVLETEVRIALCRGGLPEPDLDVEIRGADGRLLGIGDLVFRAHGVIVEVEGRHHRTDDRQWNRDLDKYAALAAAGWEVVRLTSRHVRGADPACVHLVRAALARHPLS